jgi:anti-anti-sigma factor
VSVVVLDLARVMILPSLALGMLVQISTKCKARQQVFRLAALSPQLRDILRITRLDRVLEVVDSVENAVQ